MEPKFQTSFIPKKPLPGPTVGVMGATRPTKQHHGASIFMTLAVLIFVISVGAIGGMYAWKQYLISAQAEYKKDLAEREKQFNVDLIEQLKRENVKIDQAKQVLARHVAVSQLFAFIERFTAESVRFVSMDVDASNAQTEGVKIKLNGIGTNLAAVAFQSDVFSDLEQYGLRKVVKNPILSDPNIDAKTGNVTFGFSATIDPASLLYSSVLAPAPAGTSTTQ